MPSSQPIPGLTTHPTNQRPTTEASIELSGAHQDAPRTPDFFSGTAWPIPKSALGLHSPRRIHRSRVPPGLTVLEIILLSRARSYHQTEYSARIQNVTFLFRASPSFQISPATNQRELRNAGGSRGFLGVVVYPPLWVVT